MIEIHFMHLKIVKEQKIKIFHRLFDRKTQNKINILNWLIRSIKKIKKNKIKGVRMLEVITAKLRTLNERKLF